MHAKYVHGKNFRLSVALRRLRQSAVSSRDFDGLRYQPWRSYWTEDCTNKNATYPGKIYTSLSCVHWTLIRKSCVQHSLLWAATPYTENETPNWSTKVEAQKVRQNKSCYMKARFKKTQKVTLAQKNHCRSHYAIREVCNLQPKHAHAPFGSSPTHVNRP